MCLEGILTMSCLRGSGLPHLIFLLEAPAEWLFQPLFPSHQAPSWVGLCYREKTKDLMVT